MGNRINEIVNTIRERENTTYREIAERCMISEQTLHSARKRKTMDNIHIDVFLKIAHGLGMTAEELYYGHEAKQSPAVKVNDHDRNMIDVYHAAGVHGQMHIDSVIDAESRYIDAQAKNEAQIA